MQYFDAVYIQSHFEICNLSANADDNMDFRDGCYQDGLFQCIVHGNIRMARWHFEHLDAEYAINRMVEEFSTYRSWFILLQTGNLKLIQWVNGICSLNTLKDSSDVHSIIQDKKRKFFRNYAICHALMWGHLDVAKWLRARPEPCNVDAFTLEVACAIGSHAIVTWLLKEKCSVSESCCHACVFYGNDSILMLIYDARWDILMGQDPIMTLIEEYYSKTHIDSDYSGLQINGDCIDDFW